MSAVGVGAMIAGVDQHRLPLDWKGSPPSEDEFFLEPPGSRYSSDEDDEGSSGNTRSSVDTSCSRRIESEFVLTADLSSCSQDEEEDDLFVCGTPGASDTESRLDRLLDLTSFRKQTGGLQLASPWHLHLHTCGWRVVLFFFSAALPKSTLPVQSLSSSSYATTTTSSTSSQVTNLTPTTTSSTLLYTKSLRPRCVNYNLVSHRRRFKSLKLVVSIPLSKLSDSQTRKIEQTPEQSPVLVHPEPKKLCRQQSLEKYINKQRLSRRSMSPSSPDIVITIPSSSSFSSSDGSINPQPEIDSALNSALSWETANDNVFFSPMSSVAASITDQQLQQQQPYVVTVDCEKSPSKQAKDGTLTEKPNVDKLATKLVECHHTATTRSSPVSSCQSDTSDGLTPAVDTVTSSGSCRPTTTHSAAPVCAVSVTTVGETPTNGTFQRSPFSFERVFSFYPPHLALIDGDLGPVCSLSLKGTDSMPPPNHPIHNWCLGRPVKGLGRNRKRKPVKIIK